MMKSTVLSFNPEIHPRVNTIRILTICFFTALIFLFIRTKCSPLYPFNDWVDVNAFFTMGKSMLNGKIPYRDLFEQKGPLLYLIYGIGSLISARSFLGIFILETISFTLFLYFCYKCTHLVVQNRLSLLSIPLMAFLVLNVRNFADGGSAEEFCLPFLMISIYHLIKIFREETPTKTNPRIFLLNGFITGCVICIKYSLLGFWIGWIIALGIFFLLKKKVFYAMYVFLLFMAGTALAITPWIIYFTFHQSLSEFFNTYFLFNFKYYKNEMSILRCFRFIARQIYDGSIDKILFSLIELSGGIMLLFSSVILKNAFGKTALVLSFILLVFSVYGGGVSHLYYYFILTPFVIFGVITLIHYMSHIIGNRNISIPFLILIIILAFSTYHINYNKKLVKQKKENLFQYRFAQIISKTQNASLLNYGSLDVGLYTTTGIIPNCRYFELQNIEYAKYPLNLDEQNRYIREHRVDYVIVRYDERSDLSIFKNWYDLVAKQKQLTSGIAFCYLLYRKNTEQPSITK